jgi:hypothetical protein
VSPGEAHSIYRLSAKKLHSTSVLIFIPAAESCDYLPGVISEMQTPTRRKAIHRGRKWLHSELFIHLRLQPLFVNILKSQNEAMALP